MNRASASIRRFRWRLLLAAPVLLAIAMSTNWPPFYLIFIADVGALVHGFGRRRRQLR